jgi:hypothetical protein
MIQHGIVGTSVMETKLGLAGVASPPISPMPASHLQSRLTLQFGKTITLQFW